MKGRIRLESIRGGRPAELSITALLTDYGLLDPPELLRDSDLRLDPVIRPTRPKDMAVFQLLRLTVLQLLHTLLEPRLAIARSRPVGELDVLGAFVARPLKERVEVLRGVRAPEELVQTRVGLPSDQQPSQQAGCLHELN